MSLKLRHLELNNFKSVIYKEESVELNQETLDLVEASFNFQKTKYCTE